ncbi:MAG TPA: alpha-amylase family glycosyl hydrolase [Candidatus Hydrogenedentes bacterium]|nr:alpha-amylase family glycosyl hydrolase [Candidatus Hydrogenedentota bacterium]
MLKDYGQLFRNPYAPYGYHLRGPAIAALQLGFEDLPTGSNDRCTAADRVRVARLVSARLNRGRDFSNPLTRPARAGELLILGLITEAMRHVCWYYTGKIQPNAVRSGLHWLERETGGGFSREVLLAFGREFPPLPARRGQLLVEDFADPAPEHAVRRDGLTIETLLVRVSNENPAAAPYRLLHDDSALKSKVSWERYVTLLEQWFDRLPPLPETGLPLLETLRQPIRACPDSLEGQLDFILKTWTAILPEEFREVALVARGVLREETAIRGIGPGEREALSFRDAREYAEPEAFTPDQDWMPNVILIAKSVYVWLYQLSLWYGRDIQRLDQVPDAELDRLAKWGFNALWLIGLWERSPVSRSIKRMMGNPEAEASAYSLYDYSIAGDLGGEAAFHDLAERAWRRGIRLAGDMVPNHMGIYSRWIVEHPEWFMQTDTPPFPGYRFTGPDLSPDPRVSIFLEDGYWTRTDAAVVFKLIENTTGRIRYIYHGNDGTSMPWNDTAQLNFMREDTREAVIETILQVAQKCPIIRFDAAMTLAKKHYQRLWFPKPGDGGAIPSRAEHGMSREEFDRYFPVEFWRMVVDRVAEKAPNTLLLAEAFWLMEGYFVRTLGMHRVYNSAFMNMLKMEDNAKYRQTIKNVLEFSPEILQRFVNFMNNPDEETAAAQFGKGDKYFGVATLLATMPGLPMFGHGQIEGFTEKYGMEYRRAYWDESPDEGLIARHEREIFPLLRKRRLFSGARNFAMYDFVAPEGWVDENVFVYSNRWEGERALVVYNNAYQGTRGFIRMSVAVNEGSAEVPVLRRRSLVAALGLDMDPRCYVIFREHRSGLEYLRHVVTMDRDGLWLELSGYENRVFLDWRVVYDYDLSWGKLHALIGDAGVPSVDEAYAEMTLSDILEPFRTLVYSDALEQALDAADPMDAWRAVSGPCEVFYTAVARRIEAVSGVETAAMALAQAGFSAGWTLDTWLERMRATEPALASCLDSLPGTGDAASWRKIRRLLMLSAILRGMGAIAVGSVKGDELDPDFWRRASDWAGQKGREWLLTRQVERALTRLGEDSWQARWQASAVMAMTRYAPALDALADTVWGPVLYAWMTDPDMAFAMDLHEFGGRRWINRELFERVSGWLLLDLVASASGWRVLPEAPLLERFVTAAENLQVLWDAGADTGYDFDWMLDALK